MSSVRVEFVGGPGAPFTNEEAAKIGPILESLATKRNGILSVVDLLDAASDPKSPLHVYFNWDDESAAHQYRVVQAKKLLRFIRFKVEMDGNEITPRVFSSVVLKDEIEGATPGRAFVRTTTVIQHASLSDQILERAAKELRQWKERYATHKAFAQKFQPIFHAIEEWEREVFKDKKRK